MRKKHERSGDGFHRFSVPDDADTVRTIPCV
jgi:hypothetical protein